MILQRCAEFELEKSVVEVAGGRDWVQEWRSLIQFPIRAPLGFSTSLVLVHWTAHTSKDFKHWYVGTV